MNWVWAIPTSSPGNGIAHLVSTEPRKSQLYEMLCRPRGIGINLEFATVVEAGYKRRCEYCKKLRHLAR